MPFVALTTPPSGPVDALADAELDADGVLAVLLPVLVLAPGRNGGAGPQQYLDVADRDR